MTEQESGSGGLGKVELPSIGELAKLPRRALNAFAGRCARRVQPLYKHFSPDTPQAHVDTVDRAISLVQKSAVSPVSTSDLKDARTAAHAAHRAASPTATHAARTTAHAAHAAGDEDNTHAAAYAAETAEAAEDAAGDAAAHADDDDNDAAGRAAARRAMRRDYELLKAAAEREQWTDETPVPPEFFGPLWPDGAPDGWPINEIELDSEPVELVIEMDVPDDADDEEVAERIREVVAEMDGMHRAMGGGGLKIAGVDVDVEAGIREGVPS